MISGMVLRGSVFLSPFLLQSCCVGLSHVHQFPGIDLLLLTSCISSGVIVVETLVRIDEIRFQEGNVGLFYLPVIENAGGNSPVEEVFGGMWVVPSSWRAGPRARRSCIFGLGPEMVTVMRLVS